MSNLPPECDGMTRGGCMGYLSIDPSPQRLGPPPSPAELAARIADFAAQVEAERAASSAEGRAA